MRRGMAAANPFAATALLAWRELRFRLGSIWFWAVSSATCVLAWLYGAGFAAAFATESVLVTTDPLLALNAFVVVFLGIVLGLRLAGSMAWEREHRTLEVLLIGPAGWSTIICAKFLVEIVVLALLILIYALYLALAQPLGAGVIGTSELAGLVLVPFFALPVMAGGLAIGAGLGTVRAAVVVFLAAFGALAAMDVAHAALIAQPVEQQSLTGLYALNAFDVAAPVLDHVSPAHVLATPIRAFFLQIAVPPGAVGLPLGQAALFVVLAVWIGRLRGALR